MGIISIIVSALAFTISLLTFWFTRIKMGTVKMTRPTTIFFGPDGVGNKSSKVFIRTLLYATSDRGQYIQSMFIRLKHSSKEQVFDVWVYVDKSLVRGSGLFVNKSGISSNHHFLLSKKEKEYLFLSGHYILQVFVETVNKKPRLLFEENLNLSETNVLDMTKNGVGIYFDWEPETQSYFAHIDSDRLREKELIDLLAPSEIKERNALQ